MFEEPSADIGTMILTEINLRAVNSFSGNPDLSACDNQWENA